MKKRELSAIDSIYEVLDRIKNIESHYELLNKQLAIMNNKLNKLSDQNSSLPEVNTQVMPSAKPYSSTYTDFETKDKGVVTDVAVDETPSQGFVVGKVKVFSKMMTPAKQPIPDVNVKIFSFDNKVLRNLLTDKNGYWDARLPPGRYRLTMDHSNFKTIERNIVLEKSMSTFEVK